MRRVVLLIPLTLLGCVAQALPAPALTGSQWRFTRIDGEAPAAAAEAQLTFAADSLHADVGCNAMSGPWRIEKGRLIAGPLVQTKMFCAGPVGEQELATGALLAAAPEIQIASDRLVLRSGGHEATLERKDGNAARD